MIDPDLFLGTWRLVPELSLHEAGSPPASAIYVIERVGVDIRVRIRWRATPDGEEHATGFAAPSDGSPRALDAGDGSAGDAATLRITRVDARTLDSSVERDGVRIAYARRVASEDGTLLAVVQEETRRGGGRNRNFQVYRRAIARRNRG